MKNVSILFVGLMMFACSALAQATVPADVFVKSVADDVLAIVKKDKALYIYIDPIVRLFLDIAIILFIRGYYFLLFVT